MAVDLQEYRTDQEISELKHEMAYFRGVVEQLGERVGAIESRLTSVESHLGSLESRMAAFEARTEERFTDLDKRLVRLEESVASRFTDLDKRLVKLEESVVSRFTTLESRMDSNFKWLTGFLLTSWITIVGLILTLILKSH